MNQQIVKVGQDVRRILPDTQVRTCLLPWAIGFALAAHFPVSQDPEVSGDLMFNQHIRPTLARQLSQINEDMTFDVAEAIQAAKACSSIRSRIVNQNPLAYVGGAEYDFFGIVFGLSNVVPVEVYKCMQEHCVGLGDVYCKLLVLIRDLKASNYLVY